jgi:hypothetical protein
MFRSPNMLHALELIYIDILEFHQNALRFFKGKCEQYATTLVINLLTRNF